MATILVVDDDAVDREAVARCLKGVERLEIANVDEGAAALEWIERDPPDVVLTDLRMPGMNGLELVERLRDDHPLVPVILMTSQGNEQLAVQALHAGASSYVPKRELKQALADTVLRVLEVAEARQSRQRALGYLSASETRFELENDPELIAPVVGYLQENLERLAFANDSVRSHVAMALMEAMTNGMIHGNLEVGSELRRDDPERYHEVIRERRGAPPYAARRLRLEARESSREVEYVVDDEGPGFDPTTLPDPTAPENLTHVSGRGILLIRTFMDAVEFNDRGNRIILRKAA